MKTFLCRTCVELFFGAIKVGLYKVFAFERKENEEEKKQERKHFFIAYLLSHSVPIYIKGQGLKV